MSLHGIYKTFSQTLVKYFRKWVVGATVNTEEQDFLPKQFTQKLQDRIQQNKRHNLL